LPIVLYACEIWFDIFVQIKFIAIKVMDQHCGNEAWTMRKAGERILSTSEMKFMSKSGGYTL
jgi:hypothetical protein